MSTDPDAAPDTPAPPAPPAGAPGGALLREPAHRVSPRAVPYWRLSALIGNLILVAVLGVGLYFAPWDLWWLPVLYVAIVVLALVHVIVMPPIRFRVHRWEVNDIAIHTREGWLGRETRIAPINRVQTVDFSQGPLMRAFDIASLTVTTASAAGPITIAGLDAEQTRTLAAELTAITAADEGDAT